MRARYIYAAVYDKNKNWRLLLVTPIKIKI